MSLTTRSKFYYGFEVSTDARKIDFKEGAGSELTATLDIGKYTLEQFAVVLATALNDAGSYTYTVSVNRTTRKLTVSAASTFNFLISSGSHHGTSAYGLGGFTGSDTGLATSHVSDTAAGSVYAVQFIIQSHVGADDFQNSVYGTVNKSASGKVEVVSYGTESFIQADIKYVTNINNGSDSPIRYNATGVANLRTFMQYLVTKAPLEYMPDEDTPTTYTPVILESTPDDPKGLKYKLKEAYDQGLPGYYSTGPLVFRVIEE